jgi:pyrroline-5-carboxylate reductase
MMTTTTALQELTLGFIGLGKMNGAMLQGLLNANIKSDKLWGVASSAQTAAKKTEEFGIRVYAPDAYAKELSKTDFIFLGVKPHKVADVLALLKQQLALEPMKQGLALVSVAAGIQLKTLQEALDIPLPILRVMPNIGVAVGHGVSTVCSNNLVSPEQEQQLVTLLKQLGCCERLPESLFDAATGLVGSGPAYVLLMIEALIDGAVHAGIPRVMASQMVPQLLIGTSLLLEQSGLHPAALRDTVVTPAGTTAEGLAVLEAAGVRSALDAALRASIAKSKALGLQ